MKTVVSKGVPVAAVIGGGYLRDIDKLALRHSIVHRAATQVQEVEMLDGLDGAQNINSFTEHQRVLYSCSSYFRFGRSWACKVCMSSSEERTFPHELMLHLDLTGQMI